MQISILETTTDVNNVNGGIQSLKKHVFVHVIPPSLNPGNIEGMSAKLSTHNQERPLQFFLLTPGLLPVHLFQNQLLNSHMNLQMAKQQENQNQQISNNQQSAALGSQQKQSGILFNPQESRSQLFTVIPFVPGQ